MKIVETLNKTLNPSFLLLCLHLGPSTSLGFSLLSGTALVVWLFSWLRCGGTRDVKGKKKAKAMDVLSSLGLNTL